MSKKLWSHLGSISLFLRYITGSNTERMFYSNKNISISLQNNFSDNFLPKL